MTTPEVSYVPAPRRAWVAVNSANLMTTAAAPAVRKPPKNSPAVRKPPKNSPAVRKPLRNSPADRKPPENSPAARKPPENSPAARKPPENSPPPRVRLPFGTTRPRRKPVP
jgi:hypothetical protein